MTLQAISAAAAASLDPGRAVRTQQGDAGFARALNDVLGGASAMDARADQALQQLAAGKTDNLHSVTLAAARADLSFRLVLEIRNRLQDAYQEVMRMQV